MSLRHHAALQNSFLSIAAVTGAGGAVHVGHTYVPRCCRGRRADKRHNLIKLMKRRNNKQIERETMTAFVFISGIHRTNGSNNEQYSGNPTRCPT